MPHAYESTVYLRTLTFCAGLQTIRLRLETFYTKFLMLKTSECANKLQLQTNMRL